MEIKIGFEYERLILLFIITEFLTTNLIIIGLVLKCLDIFYSSIGFGILRL
jgi:hypothetical protein